jgi:hypothetical protein
VPSAPGAPYEISQQCTSSGYARLTIGWSSVSGATSYKVYHSSGELKGTTSGTQLTLYNLPSGSGGAYLTLYVVACNEAGCSGAGSSRQFYLNPCQAPSAPGAPYEVSQQCTSSGYARLTIGWSSVYGATSYKVYHSSGELKGTTSSTQFTLYNLSSGVNGAYLTLYVVACNSYGCSGAGSSRQFYLNPCQAPSAPGAPWKVSQSCPSSGYANVTIGWSSVYGATSYKLYHSSGELKGTTSGTQLTLYNVPVSKTSTWTANYYVVACNSYGCSGAGSTGTISFSPCP